MNCRGLRKYLLILTVALTSCATIQRDIYFKEKSFSEKEPTGYLKRDLSVDEIYEVPNQRPRRLTISVLNQASGSYLAGIIIPLIPVFFLPDDKFSIQGEKLKIHCAAYLKTEKSSIPNAEWKILEAEYIKNGRDICLNAQIVLPNGQRLEPSQRVEVAQFSLESIGKNVEFTYDILASEVKEFTLDNLSIRTNKGQSVAIKKSFAFVAQDWTRYYFVRF